MRYGQMIMQTCCKSITGADMIFPIEQSLPTIKAALAAGSDVILTAEPGAGKSTIVPLALLNEPWLGNRRILILQPRRVAAIAVARRMAFLNGSAPGKLIGHNVRFSSNISALTCIEVMTEGILTRRLQNDPLLEGVGLIIFDEFHERSVHADLCLALCREIKSEVRPDLRLIVMSATMDTELVNSFLNQAINVAGKGFLHPVSISYRPVNASRDRFAAMGEAIVEIIRDSAAEEEFLIFLPGIGEIQRIQEIIESSSIGKSRLIQSLHGSMPIEEQEKALESGKQPRIILSTNIAETSLTINGITTVIDSGFCRKLSFDCTTGLEKLELERISRSSARQRAGRAGRLRPGRAFRLWSQIEFEQMPENDEPEILRIDPTGTVLEICAWGCTDPLGFSWLQSPGEERLRNAIELLKMLQAIDEKCAITSIGRQMVALPAEPRLARMLISAARSGIISQAALAAAIISEKDILRSDDSEGYFVSPDPDLSLRLEILESGGNRNNNSQRYRIDRAAASRIYKIQQQLMDVVKPVPVRPGKVANSLELLHKALLSAFPDRVCMRRGDSSSHSYTICSGQGLSLCQPGLLRTSEFILALKVDSRIRAGSNDGKIFLGCQIDPEWLHSEVGSSCRTVRELFFASTSRKVMARERVWFKKLMISNQESSVRASESIEAEGLLLQAARENIVEALALNNPEVEEFINRVSLLSRHAAGKDYPVIDADWLENMLMQCLPGCRSFADLRRHSVAQVYLQQLSWQLRENLEKLVPEKFCAPSGNSIKILYQSEGPPILAVKIQELFGMALTPTICRGGQPLLIHLLSPAGRPVQITSDLVSFWKTGYRQVVSELKGRYPRHPWPDDPATAVAFHGTRKQLERKLKGS